MTKLIQAFFYSFAGLRAAWKDEFAFRLEVLGACVLIPAAFFLAPDRISLVLMIASVLLVMLVELLNTSIEATVNRIGQDIHPLSKKAKDAGSAAVLIALLIAGCVWVGCLA